jgi:hypothetical protein
VQNWATLSESVKNERVSVNLNKKIAQINMTDDEKLLPLHRLLPSAGKNMISTIIMVRNDGINLKPDSLFKFYSDPDKVNEVYEIKYQPTNNGIGVEP